MLDWELIVFATVAVLVIARLYAVLGRKTGMETPPASRQETARPPDKPGQSGILAPISDIAGLQAIAQASADFSPQSFLEGGKLAYEVIVGAFADGNLETLRPLLTDEVFDAYAAEIKQRDKTKKEPFRLVRLKSAKIDNAELSDDGMASIATRFEAELNNSQRHKYMKEIWTFQRLVASSDPNWRLAGVEISS